MFKWAKRLVKGNGDGNWAIDWSNKAGFIVKNIVDGSEYHFLYISEGWITSKHKDAVLAYSTRSLLGGSAPFRPMLVDEKSIKQMETAAK